MSGDGTVYTYTIVRHPTHFAFADKIPYVLAIVELAEGPRLVTALTGVAPDEVSVGQPVHAVFREIADGDKPPVLRACQGQRSRGRQRRRTVQMDNSKKRAPVARKAGV